MDSIEIRKAKIDDVNGIAETIKTGIKRKASPYLTTRRYTKAKLESLKSLLSSKSATTKFFVAVNTKKGKIVGSISYNFDPKGRMRHRVDYGLGVHPDYFGRGIGTKLLKFVLDDAKKSGFKRIEGEIAIKNKASWKMALKCGFKIEGIKKKAMLMDDGKYIDTYIVGKIL